MSVDALVSIPQVEWRKFGRVIAETLKLDSAATERGRFLFRGQGSSLWGLEASFDRIAKDKLTPKERRAFYDEYLFEMSDTLNRGGYAKFPAPSKKDADSIVPYEILAQHYGAHTRLLDWSTSPYIASFFCLLWTAHC